MILTSLPTHQACRILRWWLQPYLKRLFPGGSTLAGKPSNQSVRLLHDVQNHGRTSWCKPRCRSTRARKPQLQRSQIPTLSLPLQNWHVPAVVLPIGNPTLELSPHRCSISHDSVYLQICIEEFDGRTCLVAIMISDFLNLFFDTS